MNPRCIDIVRSDCRRSLDRRHFLLEPLRKSTLVVTGGTGFIGSWLAEMVAALNDDHGFGIQLHLLARGTDQFATRMPHIASRGDVRLIKSDVRHMVDFPKDADWVIHAAANPDVRTHASNPMEVLSVIADGTAAVVRMAERLGNLRMLLNLSSGLVCGAQPLDVERLPEAAVGSPSLDASSVYANSKRFAETICAAARSQNRIPIVTARPFSFIGPYQSLATPWAQTNFLADALSGQAIRVLGDGQTVRSYLYGSDAAFWLLRILTGGESGQVFNVGSDQPVTLLQMAQRIAEHFSPSPEIKLNTAARVIGRSRLVPETTYAREKLELSMMLPLEGAIESTVRWHLAAGAKA